MESIPLPDYPWEHPEDLYTHPYREVEGNLLNLALQGHFDAIVHGCNCFCNMGAGIALQIMRNFPEAYEADKKTIKGDGSKLGTYTKALIVRPGVQFYIINAYTQYGCNANKIQLNYHALDMCFEKIALDFGGQRIGYPLIGAGLAGGDWNIIAPIINQHLDGICEHTLVRYVGKNNTSKPDTQPGIQKQSPTIPEA